MHNFQKQCQTVLRATQMSSAGRAMVYLSLQFSSKQCNILPFNEKIIILGFCDFRNYQGPDITICLQSMVDSR